MQGFDVFWYLIVFRNPNYELNVDRPKYKQGIFMGIFPETI